MKNLEVDLDLDCSLNGEFMSANPKGVKFSISAVQSGTFRSERASFH